MNSTPPEAAAPLPPGGAAPAARRSRFRGACLLASLVWFAASARADTVDTLREFVREVKSGRAVFTQVISSADGQKKRSSSGSFEFERPNRFRFAYTRPFEQVIVADGSKVWIYDRDLNQVASRRLAQAIGATPAALLAGGALDKDFTLKALPDRDGLAWVEATPRAGGGSLQTVRIGFRGKALAAVEIRDAFGQDSLLQFSQMTTNQPPVAEHFRFAIPPGADVIEQ